MSESTADTTSTERPRCRARGTVLGYTIMTDKSSDGRWSLDGKVLPWLGFRRHFPQYNDMVGIEFRAGGYILGIVRLRETLGPLGLLWDRLGYHEATVTNFTTDDLPAGLEAGDVMAHQHTGIIFLPMTSRLRVLVSGRAVVSRLAIMTKDGAELIDARASFSVLPPGARRAQHALWRREQRKIAEHNRKYRLFTFGEPHGLKCDAEGCDYRDDTIPMADYAKWVDAPCPKCGASLLTQADFKLAYALQDALMWVNRWFGWIAYFRPNATGTRFNIASDGRGKPIITRAQAPASTYTDLVEP